MSLTLKCGVPPSDGWWFVDIKPSEFWVMRGMSLFNGGHVSHEIFTGSVALRDNSLYLQMLDRHTIPWLIDHDKPTNGLRVGYTWLVKSPFWVSVSMNHHESPIVISMDLPWCWPSIKYLQTSKCPALAAAISGVTPRSGSGMLRSALAWDATGNMALK